MLAEGLRRDGADGDGEDAGERKLHTGAARRLGQVLGGGGACKQGCVDGLGKRRAEEHGGVGGQRVAVGLDHVYSGAGGAEGVGNEVAGDLGAGKEDAAAGERLLGRKSFDEAFGYVALGNERDSHAFFGESVGRRGSDSSDAGCEDVSVWRTIRCR